LYIPILVEVSTLVFAIILCLFEWILEEDYFSTKFSSRSNLLVCVINEIATLSFFGQRLTEKSSAICEKIYNIEWNDLRQKNFRSYKELRSLMVITMIRSKRVEVISAGGIMNFNLPTFMAVSRVQSSSYLNKFYF
jgi:hypothetical protein